MTRSLLAVMLLGACAGPSAAPDAPLAADVPAATDAPERDAPAISPLPLPFYEVPVDDPALASHAFFAVPDVHYVASGGVVTLTYDFPMDLGGVEDVEVVLSGPVDAEGNAEVTGPAGSGSCAVSDGVVRCLESFTDLPIDLPAARAMAEGYSAAPADVAARVGVLEAFGADPIGIVVFDLATASEPTDD